MIRLTIVRFSGGCMAKCVKCGVETELHVCGYPMCVDCADDDQESFKKPPQRESKPAAKEAAATERG